MRNAVDAIVLTPGATGDKALVKLLLLDGSDKKHTKTTTRESSIVDDDNEEVRILKK